MNRFPSLFSCLLLGMTLVALAGCHRPRPLTTPEPHWKPVFEEPAPPPALAPEPPPEPKKTPDPLAYFNYLQGMSDAEQQKEFKKVKRRFAKTAEEEDRWRLIFLSTLPGQSFSDSEQALELLRNRKAPDDPMIDFRSGLSKLLIQLLTDQNKCKARLLEERHRAEKLAQQLRELKEIETILGEREKSRPASQ